MSRNDNRTWSAEEIRTALNAAADASRKLFNPDDIESSSTIRDDDIVNLLVNAADYLLEHPEASLDDIILAQYASMEIDESYLENGEEIPAQGSARWNELVIEEVRSWFSL